LRDRLAVVTGNTPANRVDAIRALAEPLSGVELPATGRGRLSEPPDFYGLPP
jgi:hypothetical protein